MHWLCMSIDKRVHLISMQDVSMAMAVDAYKIWWKLVK